MEAWREELYHSDVRGVELWRNELYHFGIKGQRWGIRRFQNLDGSYTAAGKARLGIGRVTSAIGDAFNSIKDKGSAAANDIYGKAAGSIENAFGSVKEKGSAAANNIYEKIFKEKVIPEQKIHEQTIPEQKIHEQTIPEQKIREQTIPEQKIYGQRSIDPFAIKTTANASLPKIAGPSYSKMTAEPPKNLIKNALFNKNDAGSVSGKASYLALAMDLRARGYDITASRKDDYGANIKSPKDLVEKYYPDAKFNPELLGPRGLREKILSDGENSRGVISYYWNTSDDPNWRTYNEERLMMYIVEDGKLSFYIPGNDEPISSEDFLKNYNPDLSLGYSFARLDNIDPRLEEIKNSGIVAGQNSNIAAIDSNKRKKRTVVSRQVQ